MTFIPELKEASHLVLVITGIRLDRLRHSPLSRRRSGSRDLDVGVVVALIPLQIRRSLGGTGMCWQHFSAVRRRPIVVSWIHCRPRSADKASRGWTMKPVGSRGKPVVGGVTLLRLPTGNVRGRVLRGGRAVKATVHKSSTCTASAGDRRFGLEHTGVRSLAVQPGVHP